METNGSLRALVLNFQVKHCGKKTVANNEINMAKLPKLNCLVRFQPLKSNTSRGALSVESQQRQLRTVDLVIV